MSMYVIGALEMHILMMMNKKKLQKKIGQHLTAVQPQYRLAGFFLDRCV